MKYGKGKNESYNAVILAAGKSSRFAPFIYERPKGLFRIKGEILIERQVEQMIEAGIRQIIIVVGYMKEKFFYLERKYPQVHLVVNNRFEAKGNIYSLYVVRKYLANTYLSYSDYYYESNPFFPDGDEARSYCACIYRNNTFGKFTCRYSDAHVITHVSIGGFDQMAMLGHLRFSESFSKRLVTLLENEIDDFRISSLFFEEFYQRHVQELTLYLRVFDEQDIVEFDSIDDLRTFDADFFSCVDSEIVTNICHSLACSPNAIKDIAVIHAGLTNVSFMFRVAHNMFVYRHPGGTSGNLINRKNERIAQSIAKELGIDNSLVNISSEGWKISRYVQNLVSCDFRKNDWQLRKGMDYLRKIHSLTAQDVDGMKVFDNYEEGVRLMRIASATKGNLLSEFADEIEKTQRLSNFLKSDAERLGYKRVCCHNDVYAPNFLATANRELYLIDWEFAGLNYAANDLACIFSRYEYSEEDIERFLEVYLQHAPTKDEHRFYTSFIPLKAFYWLGWGVYKGSMGEDDGFFFLPAYRIFHRFIDDALASYEK